ncbi:O-acetyl-ADP-ribose deacetylase [Proteiniclasticum ruminis]|uniref:O-acetyl-ADP-ribose deacetylase (Regulator of RNase III), contains Macro domain n=1 Tax=Proteiniclasticum ruminis TaxID=398199 RepID=A0A1I5BDV5_9CLOT|nr:O-acetyl-ADP-ribose deacetylase [Proteiniclasticum ruminis]SFN72866.1 O-acetyl-ADP-ribose deacetylase (regulator of RNase III), contains Macro domain [Proteiniclasticum ruminis]
MPLELIREDITRMKVDAIVNAANESLLGGGGVDGAIHRAAGKDLLEECKTLGGCRTGEAKITKGYDLPADYIIHTVGPRYVDGNHGEEELLQSAYRNSLLIAKEKGLQSIAFPLISAGIYGYPKKEAMKVAVDTIRAFLKEEDLLVYLVLFDKGAFLISQNLHDAVKSYVDDHYVEEKEGYFSRDRKAQSRAYQMEILKDLPVMGVEEAFRAPGKERKLEELLHRKEETFSRMLLRLIDEKGYTDTEIYKRANMDRKLFSKIRKDEDYQPSKKTVLSLAVALYLSMDETEDLLRRAGYALSRSSRFDLILSYFIEEENYNIFEINEVLFSFLETTLTSS